MSLGGSDQSSSEQSFLRVCWLDVLGAAMESVVVNISVLRTADLHTSALRIGDLFFSAVIC